MITVKKVSAYPIPCQLVGAGSTIAAQVMKAAHSGCLISSQQPLVVNAVYQLKFVFPVTNGNIDEEVVIFKTYDVAKESSKGANSHVAEVIFKHVSDGGRRSIATFLNKLGVKG